MTRNEHKEPFGPPPLGREFTLQAGHELGRATIQRFAAATGDENPLYWEEEYAKSSPHGGIVAPPTMIFELNHNLRGALAADGFLQQLADFLAPLGLPERAGNDYTVLQAARPDDILTLRRRIVDVAEREGKSGRVIFVSSEISYSNQHGELLGTDVETMVGRQRAAHPGAGQPPHAAPAAAPVAAATGAAIPGLTIPVTPVLAATYCGATWDFTRLHYDVAFATGEGFRERVVDPQMYGAFLARMLVEWAFPFGQLRQLRLSYRAPAYVGDTLYCQGNVVQREDEAAAQRLSCALLVANQDGKPLVRGTALLALPR